MQVLHVLARPDVIYFFYGLAFFSMGLLILIYPKRDSTIAFAGSLLFLSWFGLLHGVNEWLDMWAIILKDDYIFVDTLRFFCLLGSYLVLFEFGRRLMMLWKFKCSGESPGLFFPWWLGPLMGIAALIVGIRGGGSWMAGNTFARYSIGFVGTFTTATGFYVLRPKEKLLGVLEVGHYFVLAAMFFLIYSLAGSFIVTPGDFFPANTLNTDTFLAFTHVPVQLIRACCAIGIAFSMLFILKAYNWEFENIHDVMLKKSSLEIEENLKQIAFLRESLKEKTLLLDNLMNSPDVDTSVVATDLNYTIYLYSVTAEKIFGYTPAEVIGKTVMEIHQREKVEQSRFEKGIEKVRSGSKHEYLITKKTDKGKVQYIKSRVYGMYNAQGVLDGYMLLSQDITKERSYEDMLLNYERIVSSSSEHMSLIDRDYVYRAVNDTYLKAHGKMRHEIEGCTIAELFGHDLFQALIQPMLDKCFRGETVNYQGWFDFPAIHTRYMDVWYYPVLDKFGTVTGAVVNSRDITEQQVMKSCLQTSEETLRLLIDAITESVFLLDTDGTILIINETAARRLGGKVHDLVGKNAYDLIPPENVEIRREWVRKLTETASAVSFEDMRNGTYYYHVCYPLLGENREVKGLAVYATDITRRKQYEKEILSWSIFPLENPNPVLRITRDNTIVIANPSSGPLLDCFLDACPFDAESSDSEPVSAIVEQVLSSGKRRDVEMQIKDEFYHFTIAPMSEIDCVNVYGYKITERKLYEERLKKALKEKEFLLKELHHRVKNNLQVIMGLLGLQIMQTEDDKYAAMLRESQNRIRSMALIHERLYRKGDMSWIDLKDYVTVLAQELIKTCSLSAGTIKLNIDLEDIYLNINLAIPCGIIINELLTNSLKHAFPDNVDGEISIAISVNEENKILLVYSDNGVGFRGGEEFLAKRKTLGFEIVRTLLKQLNGSLSISGERGVKAVLVFPLDDQGG